LAAGGRTTKTDEPIATAQAGDVVHAEDFWIERVRTPAQYA
jgi:hypothetical protein